MNKRGFSLVELILAVGIASMLMVGMSLFFSSTLKNTFEAQEKVVATQGQFVVNAIVREKFNEVSHVLNTFAGATPEADHLLALIKQEGSMPVTYIGKKDIADAVDITDERLVFKDFFPFNKVTQIGAADNFYGDAGSVETGGVIKWVTPDSETVVLDKLPQHFAGFTKVGAEWFIAVPDQNKIIRCAVASPSCITPTDLPVTLKTPMDVETDGTNLFVSDAGNNRVVKVTLADNSVTELAKDLNFPTGLAYYVGNPMTLGDEVLFVADTLNHQVKRIDLADFAAGSPDPLPIPDVIAGLGDTGACGSTAKYCDLNLPTGLFVQPGDPAIPRFPELYVADSGNDRILKIKDPGRPTPTNPRPFTVNFTTNAAAEAIIKKIVVSFPLGVNVSGAALTVTSSDNFNTNGVALSATNTMEYQLFSTLLEDTQTTNACGNPVCPKIQLKPQEIGPFAGTNTIQLGSDAKNPLRGSSGGGLITIDLPGFAADHSAGEEVILANTVGAGTVITFAISGLDTTGVTDSYSVIQITAYDLNDAELFIRYAGLAVGDGLLGTPDDIVEKVAWNEGNIGKMIDTNNTVPPRDLNVSLSFPTGVTFAYIANTGNSKIIKRNAVPADDEKDLNAVDIAGFSRFDYTSDFGVTSLNFKKLNSEEVLEMTLEAKVDDTTTATYKLNAKLK